MRENVFLQKQADLRTLINSTNEKIMDFLTNQTRFVSLKLVMNESLMEAGHCVTSFVSQRVNIFQLKIFY